MDYLVDQKFIRTDKKQGFKLEEECRSKNEEE
jgi:hypothetical protein